MVITHECDLDHGPKCIKISCIRRRVAGDALDIATLAYGYTRDPDGVAGVATALAAVAGATADVYCAAKLSDESKRPLPTMKDYSDRSGFPKGRPHAATVALTEAVVVSI